MTKPRKHKSALRQALDGEMTVEEAQCVEKEANIPARPFTAGHPFDAMLAQARAWEE